MVVMGAKNGASAVAGIFIKTNCEDLYTLIFCHSGKTEKGNTSVKNQRIRLKDETHRLDTRFRRSFFIEKSSKLNQAAMDSQSIQKIYDKSPFGKDQSSKMWQR